MRLFTECIPWKIPACTLSNSPAWKMARCKKCYALPNSPSESKQGIAQTKRVYSLKILYVRYSSFSFCSLFIIINRQFSSVPQHLIVFHDTNNLHADNLKGNVVLRAHMSSYETREKCCNEWRQQGQNLTHVKSCFYSEFLLSSCTFLCLKYFNVWWAQ